MHAGFFHFDADFLSKKIVIAAAPKIIPETKGPIWLKTTPIKIGAPFMLIGFKQSPTNRARQIIDQKEKYQKKNILLIS